MLWPGKVPKLYIFPQKLIQILIKKFDVDLKRFMEMLWITFPHNGELFSWLIGLSSFFKAINGWTGDGKNHAKTL